MKDFVRPGSHLHPFCCVEQLSSTFLLLVTGLCHLLPTLSATGSSARTARSQTPACHLLWPPLVALPCSAACFQELVFNDHRVKAAGRRTLETWQPFSSAWLGFRGLL